MIRCIKVALLFIFSSLSFIFSLDGEFVFDDTEAIIKNPDLNLNNSYINMFYNDFWGTPMKNDHSHKSYRPLTILTFRLNRIIDNGELVPLNFKSTNLILHNAVTLAIFYFLTHALKNIAKKCSNCFINYKNNKYTEHFWKDEAFLSSLLFSVHPVHVEAVSGIVGRADILAGLFFFLALILYNKSIMCDGKNKFLCYLSILLAIILALFAMFSKEIGITVLGICMIYEILVNFNLNLSKFSKRKHYLKKEFNSWLHKIIHKKRGSIFRIFTLIISMVFLLYLRYALMDFKSPQFQPIDNPAAFSGFFSRIITYNYIYLLNFVLLIWPKWLCFDWSMGCIPLIENILDFRILLVLIFWTAVFSLIYQIAKSNICKGQRRHLILIVSLIIIPFLPASNILMPVGFVIAERILYIPSVGYCMLIVRGFSIILRSSIFHKKKLMKLFFIILLFVDILRGIVRSHEWIDEKSLYNSALDVCPLNAKVYYNIAKNAGDHNNVSKAEIYYLESIRLYPKYYQAMNNLANLLKDQLRFSEAETLLKDALLIKEDFPAAWMNLGIVLANLNKRVQSEEAYLRALKYRKNYADCYYNLGNLYLDGKKFEEALNAWTMATKINPKHVVAWSNILALLDNTGQIIRALEIAPQALSQLPHAPAIHFNFANLLGKINEFSKAEKHFIRAIELQHDNPSALYYTNLGVLYHRWKKNNLAKKMYKKALSINPLYTSASDNLKKLLQL